MSPVPRDARTDGNDPLARLLEAGLAAVVVAAPLPFASVNRSGRLALELAAGALLVVWILRALLRGNRMPGAWLTGGLFGLLAIAALQLLPLGASTVGRISPEALRARDEVRAESDALAAEARILGADPRAFDRPAALSVDPPATASALRTGAALVALLLVAVTVTAARGPRVICWALLASATFQGLYGLLVLVSGNPVIWNVPKKFYVDCATGTFINRNHFASFLAMALPPGLALALSAGSRASPTSGLRWHLVDLLGSDGGRRVLAGLLAAVGTAGLFLSFSRAGIGLGVLALVATALLLRRGRASHGIVVALLLLAVGVVPLAQIGADRLAGRFAEVSEDFVVPGGRLVVWQDTARMLAAYPITGAGFGAFPAAYPAFRSAGVRARYDQTHNDLLQLGAEGGIPALVLLGMALLPALAAVLRALSGESGSLAVGLAAGVAVALLHALVDFNFHIPANAAAAAVLVGALLGTEWNRRA